MAKRAVKPANEKAVGRKEAKGRREQKPRPTARRLVQTAYENVEGRLQKGNGKVIEDLAKLVKLEQELTGASAKPKKIKVQWQPSSREK